MLKMEWDATFTVYFLYKCWWNMLLWLQVYERVLLQACSRDRWGSNRGNGMVFVAIISLMMVWSYYSRGCVLSRFSCVWLFATLWTVSSVHVSRQEYWSGIPCSPPGDPPNPGIKPSSPASPALQVDSLPLSHWVSPIGGVRAKR